MCNFLQTWKAYNAVNIMSVNTKVVIPCMIRRNLALTHSINLSIIQQVFAVDFYPNGCIQCFPVSSDNPWLSKRTGSFRQNGSNRFAGSSEGIPLKWAKSTCITLVTKSNKHFITHGVLFQMAILLLIFYGICYILTNKKKLINAGEKEEHELHWT